MKKTYLAFLFSILFCLTMISQNNCDRRIKVAQKYLEEKYDIKDDLLDEVINSIDSCFTEDGISFYLKGLIELRRGSTPNYTEAIKFLKNSSELNFTRAKTYLGYFYKNGWGTEIDFEKSLYWIKQAADEDDDNALYTLGYYYLKGLGNLEPNYEKAVEYFEKSNHKMAKHWLGFCKYFGFGIEKDKWDAEAILESNENNPNSEDLLKFLEEKEFSSIDFENYTSSENSTSMSLFNGIQNEIHYGTWIEKDWKNEKVFRKVPLTVETDEYNPSNIKLKILDDTYNVKVDPDGTSFESDIEFLLNNPFSDIQNPEINTYKITNATIKKDLDLGLYNIECSIWIKEYQEKGSPVTITVYTKEALQKQLDRSFKVYPTLFQNSFNFSIDIEHESNLSIMIYDLSGNICATNNYGKYVPGKVELIFENLNLKKENYIAVLNVNNIQLARRIVKIN